MTEPAAVPTRARILIVGSGAREHALAWACRQSPHCGEVICAPGNAGTAELARNVGISATAVPALVALARDWQVDLVVIGPDAAVAAGLADACWQSGIPVFGPTAGAGHIESSKRFAKRVMDAAGIPTAPWCEADALAYEHALAYIESVDGRCVVKADGLALGKGVVICDSVAEARAALLGAVVEGRLGDAGRSVVVEQRLEGREVSVFAISDGEHVRMLGSACDYKRAADGERGPNTGGMGAYTPPAGVDGDELLHQALHRVMQPCIDALRQLGTPYRGCLYAGLMLDGTDMRVLEFNARFGDPEAQVLLPLLAEDVVELFWSAARGEVGGGAVKLRDGACTGVVVACEEYPEPMTSARIITGLDRLDDGVLCFHAGTTRDSDGALRTAGGRVLTVVACAADLAESRRIAYENAPRVRFEGARYRSDIALVQSAAEARG